MDRRFAYLYKLRKNNVLNWVETLEDIIKYKEILKKCSLTSKLSVVNGIVSIDSGRYYISHKFVPHVKAGFNFDDLAIIMRYEIIKFEDEYGEVNISETDIYKLKKIIYKFNKIKYSDLDMEDKKLLIHLEDSALILQYLQKKK